MVLCPHSGLISTCYASMSITIDWDRDGDVLFAEVHGRVDSNNAFDFELAIRDNVQDDDANLVFDLEGVTFMSSSGLRICLLTAKKYNKPGMSFGICSLPEPVREVMKISGFDQIIAIYRSQSEAISAMTGAATDTEARETKSEELRAPEVREEIDFGIVKDNIIDIANYTIEKYEYRENVALDERVRTKAVGEVHAVLWKIAERLTACRQKVLQDMFEAAEDTLISIVEPH